MHGTYSVSQINRDGHLPVRYLYNSKDHPVKLRLGRKESDDGAYLKTRYYRKGKNKGRVRMQLAPVGPNGEEIVTHRYYYPEGKRRATVLDAYNNITRYYWDKNKRLKKVVKFDNNKQETT